MHDARVSDLLSRHRHFYLRHPVGLQKALVCLPPSMYTAQPTDGSAVFLVSYLQVLTWSQAFLSPTVHALADLWPIPPNTPEPD